jgi:hypothetical protein
VQLAVRGHPLIVVISLKFCAHSEPSSGVKRFEHVAATEAGQIPVLDGPFGDDMAPDNKDTHALVVFGAVRDTTTPDAWYLLMVNTHPSWGLEVMFDRRVIALSLWRLETSSTARISCF